MIELPEGIVIEEVAVEKRYRSVTTGLLRRMKNLYDTIYERYGEPGLDLIREASTSYGLKLADRAKGKLPGQDARSVGLYLVRVFNTVRGSGKVIEFTNERVVIRIYECPYPFDRPEICEAHTAMEKALVETLGSNLYYSIPKSIPRGDPYCEHLIERKNQSVPGTA